MDYITYHRILSFCCRFTAFFIIVLITALVYRGMKESRNASNMMVVVKLCIILLVIAVGVLCRY
jgi:amino acid transporter